LRTAILVLLSVVAQAKKEDLVTTAARQHFELGRALFKQGRYQQALKEFESGYQMVPKPQFLLNMGQAHRHLGEFDEAARMYERFLAEAPSDDPDRPAVNDLLAEVRRELDKRKPPPQTSEPKIAIEPKIAPEKIDQPALVVTPPPPEKKKSRTPLIVGVVVGVVAAGALAIGLGVGLTQTKSACSGSQVPCLDLGAR
jgi:tetratricopeptide (TPR) repeat protein